MADSVQPTENDLKIAWNGQLIQFGSTDLCKNTLSDLVAEWCSSGENGDPPTVETVIHHLGLYGYMKNNAEVLASERAYTRMLQNILNKDLNTD